MDFGKSNIAPALPELPVAKPMPSAGEKFVTTINDLFNLANTGKINTTAAVNNVALQTQNPLTLNQSIQQSPELTDQQKKDYLRQTFFQGLNQDKSNMFSPSTVPITEVEPYMETMDFEKLGYQPFADNDKRYLAERSAGNSAHKIFNKFLTSTGVGAASIATPAAWVADKLFDTNMSVNVADRLAQWQTESEKYNKIFYTPEEQQASGMNPFTTPTKFFDNLLPSVGFTVGNIGGTYLLGGALGLVGRAFAPVGAGIVEAAEASALGQKVIKGISNLKLGSYKQLAALDDAIMTESGLVEGTTQTVKAISEAVGSKPNAFLTDFTKALPYSVYSGAAEGHIEAATAKQEFIDNSILQYKKDHGGATPDANELAKIQMGASAIYDRTLAYNTGLLALTNTLEIGALLSKFGLVGKMLETPGLRRVGKAFNFNDVTQDVATQVWRKRTFKELLVPGAVASLVEAGGESFEEGSQYMISHGLQSWATQKYLNPNAESVKKGALDYIFNTDNLTDEFYQNAYFGGLAGLGMGGFTKAVVNPIQNKINKTPDVAQQKADLLNIGNEMLKRGASSSMWDSVDDKLNIYSQNAEQLKKFLENGDIFALKNIDHNNLYTWVASSMKAGGFELRLEQLRGLKKLKGDAFKDYFGLEDNFENRETVSKYLDKIGETGKQYANVIDNFANIENTFKFTNKPESELTEKEKADNERYENFENAKWEMAYRYTRIQDFDKRTGNILGEIEDKFAGTGLITSLKDIIFTPNGIETFKGRIQSEIQTLKDEAALYSEGGNIFKEDFVNKLREIKKREQLLEALDLTKKDYESLLEKETGDTSKYTEDQKANILMRLNEIKDNHVLDIVTKYELEKISQDRSKTNTPFEIEYKGEKLTTLKDIQDAFMQPIGDLYLINKSKGIVLDKFNRLNTKAGVIEFLDQYAAIKKEFEEGSSEKQRTEEQDKRLARFNEEIRQILKDKGYPDTKKVGIKLRVFRKSDKSVKDLPEYLDRLDEAKQKAEDKIVETTTEGKTTFSTKFTALGKEYELKAPTRDGLLAKINDRYQRSLEQSPEVLTEMVGTLQSFSVLDPKTKQLTKVYKITDENGNNIFKKNFTPREVRDLLASIQDFRQKYDIVSYDIMSKDEFDKFEEKQRATLNTAQRLDKVEIALAVTDQRIKDLSANPIFENKAIFDKIGDVPLSEVLQDGYYRAYGFAIELKKLNTQLDNIRKEQAEASKKYREETGKNGFGNTKTNKEFKNRIQETIAQINDVTAQLEENQQKLEQFQKDNENHAQLYNDYRELSQQLVDLIKDKQLLEFYKDKIAQTLDDLKSGRTTTGFNSVDELQQLNDELATELKSVTDKDVADLEKIIKDSLEKERQIRELGAVYSGMIYQHQKKIRQNNTQIKELQAIVDEINGLTSKEKKEVGKRLNNQLLETQNTIDDLNKQNLALQQEIDGLNQKIDSSIKALISKNADALGLGDSIIASMDKIERVKNLFKEISKIYVQQSYVGELQNLDDTTKGEYHSQRRIITVNGKVYELEYEPVKYDEDKRYKPNEVFQTTGVDIDSLDTFNALSTSELEEQFPQLEYYRFLSAFTPSYIAENFSVLIITPELASKLGKDNAAFADLYKHLQQQNAKNPNKDESSDLFTVVVDKKSGKLIKQNGKFLSGSLFKGENKFKLNDEGKLQYITERKVLDIYKTSDEYINDIDGLTEDQLKDYLKDPSTLSKAIAYAEKQYKEEIQSLIDSNKNGKVLVSDINDVTAGIFLRSDKEQSVAKVMGITKENADDFSLAIATEGSNGKGSLMYIDKEGNPAIIAENVALGTVGVVNRKTGEWIPVDNTKQDKGFEDVLGVMLFTVKEAQRTGKKILNVASKTKLSYGVLADGKERYQLFVNNAGERKGQKDIPLFQVLSELSHNKDTVNFSKRWSVMTSLINWGRDRKNPKNSLYFDGKNQLNYYSFKENNVAVMSMDKLSTLLDAYEKNNVDELSEQDQELLKDLINTLQQKFKNVSSQYALNTSWLNKTTNKVENLPFLKPTYNKKTGAIEFVTYDSYLSYVLGLEKGSPIVKTNIVKVDGRTSVQKSLILKTNSQGTKLVTREMTSLPTDVKDVNTKTTSEETKEDKATPTNTGTPIDDISALSEQSVIIPVGEKAIYINPKTGNVARASGEKGEEGGIVENTIAILKADVEANKDLLDIFNQINNLFEELSTAPEGFEKQLIRDSIKARYYNLVKGLKNIALSNNALTNKQIAEREEYNKDKDAKLIQGAVIEVEGADTFRVTKFVNTIAGSTAILESLTGGKPMSVSSATLILGLNENKVKIADNQEVKQETPVTPEVKPTTTEEMPIEEVYKKLQDMNEFPKEDSFENTISFLTSMGGFSLEDAYQSLRDMLKGRAAKPADSMVDLTLEKIVKDNNITKKC